MSFSWPWALLALLAVPLLLVARWWLNRRRKRAAVTVSSVALIRAALPGRTSWRRRIPVYLFLAGLLALAGGAGPAAGVGGRAVERPPRSCWRSTSPARCAPPTSRPTGSPWPATRPASSSRPRTDGTRIGLVAFSGIAGLLVPPTTDKDALLDAIDSLQDRPRHRDRPGDPDLDRRDRREQPGRRRHRRRPRRRRPRTPRRLRAGHHRGAHRRLQHHRRRPGDRRRAGRRPPAAGLHDRLRHHRARPDGVHRRPAQRRLRLRPGRPRRRRLRRWRRPQPARSTRRR